MIAELKISFTDPGAPGVYMYFEKTFDWSEELIQQFFEQNKATFGDGAEKIEQTCVFDTREEAEVSVRARSIDNWNHKDIYLWPPHVVAQTAQVVPDYMPAQGREAALVPVTSTSDPLLADDVKTTAFTMSDTYQALADNAGPDAPS